MRIKIISDSTCDLSPQLLKEHDIGLIPLIVVKGNEEFLDGVTITPADVFAHVAAGGNLCSTAARGISVFQEKFAMYAKDYDGVIHINISSFFSSSYQTPASQQQILTTCGLLTPAICPLVRDLWC